MPPSARQLSYPRHIYVSPQIIRRGNLPLLSITDRPKPLPASIPEPHLPKTNGTNRAQCLLHLIVGDMDTGNIARNGRPDPSKRQDILLQHGIVAIDQIPKH